MHMHLFSERGVTANIPVLGTGDSGFESRRSDNYFYRSLCYNIFIKFFYYENK